MRLEGKSIVITGASSGMGAAMVALFAREGAKVLAVARRQERLEALATSLEDCPGQVVPFAGDITLQQVNEAMIDAAVSQFGRLDVLVNNAGIMDDMSPLGDVTNQQFEKLMQVNTYGPMYAMRKAIHVFQAQADGGNIINVASLGAMRVCVGAAYAASKAAITALTRHTAYMYNPQGIRCNAIAPGGVLTDIHQTIGKPNPTGYERIQKVLATAPEPGKPEDVAHAALFLASDESRFVNGEVLVVDGGWNAG